MSGFKATAYKYSTGCNLIIDNCCRFLSSDSVLQYIQDVYDKTREKRSDLGKLEHVQFFQNTIRNDLIGQSVIAQYGNKQTYIVKDVIFDQSPVNSFFNWKNNQKVSIASYFFKQYGLKITDKKQPLLDVGPGTKRTLVCPEFMRLNNIPDTIRNNPMAMKDLLAGTRLSPDEKMHKIQGMIEMLNNVKTWKEWDIQIESKP